MMPAQIRLCSFLDKQHRKDMLQHTVLAAVLTQLMPDSLSLEGCKELVSQVTQHTDQHRLLHFQCHCFAVSALSATAWDGMEAPNQLNQASRMLVCWENSTNLQTMLGPASDVSWCSQNNQQSTASHLGTAHVMHFSVTDSL